MAGKLYFGDCLKVLPKLESKSIHLVLCDLPYGITQNKWDSEIDLPSIWHEWKRLLVPNGVVALTASQPFTSTVVQSNLKWFRHEWIWIKNRGSNFANTVREPMKEHESVLVFSPGKWTYNKQMQERTGGGLDRAKYNVSFQSQSSNYREFKARNTNALPELRVPSSWQKFNTETKLHPTQKPIELMKYLIKTYTNEGDIVLDNCMGSGTTCLAAKVLKRSYIGIENNKDYYKVAKKRIFSK